MSVVFSVDDVAVATSPPKQGAIGDRFPDALVLGMPRDLPVVDAPAAFELGMPTDPRGIHPLLLSVHLAFAEHRPLALSPDAVWITIAQGVAQHVRVHAEELRGRFVRHDGKKELTVVAHSWETADDWQRIVADFRAALGHELGDGVARLLTCDFSTTTDVERTASEIVLMDAFSPYFDCSVACVCGIPEITLRGTLDDWRAIRERIDVIAELGLGFWTSSLAPMADQWVRAAEGKPDRAFWQSIYKPAKAYGWDRICGWIARLYPYLANDGRFTRPNPLLVHRLGKEPKAKSMFEASGMTASEAPSGISQVRCKLEHQATKNVARVLLEGGVVGVTCDDRGVLEARCGWLLRRESPTMRGVIERMRETTDVVMAPATAREQEDPSFFDSNLGGELTELFDECDGVVLFGKWTVTRPGESDRITLRSPSWRYEPRAERVVDLGDGTFLANVAMRSRVWIRMRTSTLRTRVVEVDEVTGLAGHPREILECTEDAAMLPVVGMSIAALLAHALDTAGETDLPIVGMLGENAV